MIGDPIFVERLDQLQEDQLIIWVWSQEVEKDVVGIRPIGRVRVNTSASPLTDPPLGEFFIECLDSKWMIMDPAKMLQIGKQFFIVEKEPDERPTA